MGLTIPASLAEPKHNLDATAPPTANDDETLGYFWGSHWIDRVAKSAYVCVDPSTGAANWAIFGGAGAGSALVEVSLNRGTHVPAGIGRLFLSVGNVPTSAVPITLPIDTTLEDGWIEVDVADGVQAFTLDVELVGFGVIATIPLLPGMTQNYTSGWAINLNAGDELRITVNRIAGAARSAFSNILAGLSLRER